MLLIIDGHSLAYKFFYKVPDLRNSKNIPTSIIHLFLNTLFTLREKLTPTEIAVVFDSKGETKRHIILKDYKGTRPPTPPELITQVELLKELIPMSGIDLYAEVGIEADDIIYTLAERYHGKVLIVTKDKDICQIVSDDINLYDYQEEKIIGTAEVISKFEVAPSQIADYLALCGDTSDNIPGVKGIGPKGAVQLLKEFHTLNGIYENLDKIKPSLKTKLETEKASAFLSRELTVLSFIEDIASHSIGRNDLTLFRQRLEELELNSFIKRFLSKNNTESHFNLSTNVSPYICAWVEDCIYLADNKGYKAIDIKELSTINPVYYYSLKDIYKNGLSDTDNLKYDLQIISWLNDPDSGGIKKSKDEDISVFLKNIAENAENEIKKADDTGVNKIYAEMEFNIIKILADMENAGIKADSGKIDEIDKKIITMIDAENENISKMLGSEINLNSPKQLSFILFDKLMLTPFKKTKTGYSTDEESLRNMIPLNQEYSQLLNNIIRHRELAKLHSTYTSKLGNYINKVSSRIHSEFKQTGTATGRLSSQNPNLQNIPQKGELAYEIRNSFIAENGYTFLSFDYSQIELRILAHLSNDTVLIESFNAGLDIHTITASKIFEIPEASVTPDKRKLAKSVNFGIIYGLSPFGLSRDSGITQKDAKIFIEKYFKTYPGIKSYIDESIANASKNTYVETMFGRKRFVKDINSGNINLKGRAERISVNAPIQGSAADIIKMAMIETTDIIKMGNYDAKLILQIHDELIFEVERSISNVLFEIIKDVMENVVKLKVPLIVNGYIGDSLGDLKG